MTTIHDVADYVTLRLANARQPLNQLKLQKLLYYIQAWYLAHYNVQLFPGRFQAWVHGPVNRELYDRYRPTKQLYSPIVPGDVQPDFHSAQRLQQREMDHINAVLETYAGLTGDQLEAMTHNEDPWIVARGNIDPDARCDRELDEGLMAGYYRARVG